VTPVPAEPIASSIANEVQSFRPGELAVDARRFQFKEGGDETGLTERLAGVERLDPIKAGMAVVFQDRDGTRYIVDGHQRLGLARRIAAADPAQDPRLNAFVLRAADGVTDAEARAAAAAKNIAEGTGTAIDAAKVLRARPELVRELPPRSELVRQAKGLVNLRVHEAGERLADRGVANPYVAAAQQLADQVQAKALAERLDTLRNATARQARIAEATRGNSIATTADTLRGRLVWQPGSAATGNVQTLARGLTHDWESAMFAQLQKAGLTKAIGSPQMFRDVARAIGEMRGWGKTEAASAPAKRIAEIIAPVQEAIRNRLNTQGARIADATDWAAQTQHDPFLMRRGGRDGPALKNIDDAFRRWWGIVEPRLAEKTFDEVLPRDGEVVAATRERFGRSVFNALYTGIHMREGASLTERGFLPEGRAAYLPAGFEGAGNLARKLSEGRTLFWKDADAWSDYMERYGRSTNWFSLMHHAAEQGGRKAALMHFFGTNPAGNLDLITRRIAEQFRDRDPEGVKAFLANVGGSNLAKPPLDQILARLDGRGNVPQSEMWHRIGSTVRAFNDMVYLGFVAGTHAGSLVSTFPSEARLHGYNALSSLGGLIKAMVPDRLKPEERAEVLAQLGAYGDGMARHAIDPFAQGWNIPGYIAAMHNRFMSATGLPYLFEHAKAGMREMLADHLGRNVGQPFAALEQHLQNALRGYGIGSQEWELLRTAGTLDASGHKYLTPQAGQRVDAAAAEALLRSRGVLGDKSTPEQIAAAVDGLKRDLGDGLMMYYQDAADRSTVTAGAREQAFLRGSMKPGSVQDELVASLMQFKTWPVAALHQVLGRQFYDSVSRREAVWGVGAVVGLSMLGGYLRMTARDLAYGDEPRLPKNVGDAAKIALAALAQGGGLGIFGDFLFGEANRMGASNLSSLGGPVATDLSRLYEIYNRWLTSIGTDHKGDAWSDLARWGIDHVPFAGLFYLKGAANYLLWFHLFEAMHPGWWERTNRRMEREQGRHMMGYSPGGGVPWGVPGIYTSARGRRAGLLAGAGH
jgi:hypothetical protein